ncbi:MAG: DUF2207 domain-containing protein [Methanothermobacter tenebrarum]|nr:DUF2207 domain-containing protein [Methanothermobacter sp.]
MKIRNLIIITAALCAIIVAFTFIQERSYSIQAIDTELFLKEDGTIHVKETIHYSFNGTWNGITREIPLRGSQAIQNLNVSADGAYVGSCEVEKENNIQNIKVYLYSDPRLTKPITDQRVNVTFEYDAINVLRFYNDITELHYKIIGEGWKVPIGQVNTRIHLPRKDGVKYWLNPPYYVKDSKWRGNTLEVTADTIPAGQFFEVEMVIPKEYFAANPANGTIINQDALAIIEGKQEKYQEELAFKNILYSLTGILLLIASFTPLLIYLKYGREPKIDYRADYEHEIPYDDPPAVVNAIYTSKVFKGVGEPDMNGFKATIMDLINRNYLKVETRTKGKTKRVFLKINKEKGLEDFEMYVMRFLRRFKKGDLIELDEIPKKLSKKRHARYFKDVYDKWKNSIKTKFLNKEKIGRIFINKGAKYMKVFGFIGVALAIIVAFLTIQDPLARLPFFASILLAITSIIAILLPEDIPGHWTREGREHIEKWKNFKKYLKDFSLIKEYPPESVEIWNKYLVYATALGIADNVIKAMKFQLPQQELEENDMYVFHDYGGYALLSSALATGMSTATEIEFDETVGDTGDIGDIGGGDMGGGGDAF